MMVVGKGEREHVVVPDGILVDSQLTILPSTKTTGLIISVTAPFLCIKVAIQYKNKWNKAAHSVFSFAFFII